MLKLKNLKSSLKLYAVTDRHWLGNRKLKDDVKKAILGGATMIQLREKDLDFDSFVKEALEIKEVCNEFNIPFIINDSLDVFLAVDADGIHVGQNDLSADIVREKIGNDKILGVSAKTVEEAILAEKMGASYLGVGSVFTTSTKLDADFVSKDVLTDICNSVSIPVVAIGGITLDNIKELRNTMIDGISVVSAIFASKDIEYATSLLDIEVDKILFNPNKYRMFIVDYDGTILDSMGMWSTIASRYVKSKGLNPIDTLDYDVRLQTNDETASYLKNLYFNDKTVDEILNDINDFIAKEYVLQKLNPNAKKLLADLRKCGRVVLFSATSCPLIEKSLANNSINDYFDYLYTSTNFNYTKVGGIGFLKLIEEEGFDLSDVIVLEDSIHAIKGAFEKKLNVLVISTNENYKHIDEISSNANYLINLKKY